ncbi:MAG: acyl carrier protein [Hyphomicrobiaceae bacterium]
MNDAVGLVSGPGAGAVRPQIVEIFADVFQYHGPIDLETSRQDVKRWDSLQHVALVVALEGAFGISLSMDEMAEMNSVRDIHAVLTRYGV